ncbi:hypothetical protein QYM36_003816 [Artemia franciscana]|uniref:C2 domain-containing protein n=1 Tax=Artemia franciscana TaxID=6661 RepID=A0AA88I4G4_ARTSF|nr:hypothetical protein QYM36_003816 [Artemia franciscana]
MLTRFTLRFCLTDWNVQMPFIQLNIIDAEFVQHERVPSFFEKKLNPIFYVKMSCNKKVYPTAEVKNGMNPGWNQTFLFQEGDDTFLTFRLKEKGKILGIIKRGKQVGHGEKIIKGTLRGGNFNVPIRNSGRNPEILVGYLRIKVVKVDSNSQNKVEVLQNQKEEQLQPLKKDKIEECKKNGNKFGETVELIKPEKDDEKNYKNKKMKSSKKLRLKRKRKLKKLNG